MFYSKKTRQTIFYLGRHTLKPKFQVPTRIVLKKRRRTFRQKKKNVPPQEEDQNNASRESEKKEYMYEYTNLVVFFSGSIFTIEYQHLSLSQVKSRDT